MVMSGKTLIFIGPWRDCRLGGDEGLRSRKVERWVSKVAGRRLVSNLG